MEGGNGSDDVDKKSFQAVDVTQANQGNEDLSSNAAGGDPGLRLNLAWLETWDPNADTEDPSAAPIVPEAEMPWNAMMEAWSSGLNDNSGMGVF